MILYYIQIHKNIEQTLKLIDLLYHEVNRYLISIDGSVDLDVSKIHEYFNEKEFSGYVVRKSLPITWGGISQVYALLDALRFSLDCIDGWKYFINLSGECVPLKSQPYIQKYLALYEMQNIHVHFSRFGEGVNESIFHTTRFGEEVPLNPNVQHISFFDRVDTIIQESVKEVFLKPNNPLMDWRHRGSIHVTDLTLDKKLVIRRVFPFEKIARESFLKQYTLHGGRAWYILSKTAVQGILNEEILPDIIQGLQNYLCPDELFLQTLVLNGNKISTESITFKNYRYSSGDPLAINDLMLDDLFASDDWFARKINYHNCPKIYDKALDVVREDSIDLSLKIRNYEYFNIVKKIKSSNFGYSSIDDFETEPFDSNHQPTELNNSLFYCYDFNKNQAVYTTSNSFKKIFDCPFLYQAQYNFSDGVITVPQERIDEVISLDGVKPTFIFSIGRCGSTLISNILKSVGFIAASEPDLFTQLAVSANPKVGDIDSSLIDKIIQACVTSISTHTGQEVFIKLRSQCNVVVQHIFHAFPEANYVFIFRRTEGWMKSMYLAFGILPQDLVHMLKAGIEGYRYLVDKKASVQLMWYEDIVENPLKAYQLITFSSNYPNRKQERLIKAAMKQDSQLGTGISREDLSKKTFSGDIRIQFQNLWHESRPLDLIKLYGLSRLD